MRVDGQEQATWVVQHEGELNRRGLPVVIPPGATVTVEFSLSGPLDIEEGYRLTVLHQPLVVDDQLSLAVGDTDGVTWTEQTDEDTTAPETGHDGARTFTFVFLADE